MNEHVSTGHTYKKEQTQTNTKQGSKQVHICAAWALKTTISILEGVKYIQLLPYTWFQVESLFIYCTND